MILFIDHHSQLGDINVLASNVCANFVNIRPDF
jgi:hypothetical protein